MPLIKYKAAGDSYLHWFHTDKLLGINEARDGDTIVLVGGDKLHTVRVESAAAVAKAVMETERTP